MLSSMAADDSAHTRALEDRAGYYKSGVASHRYTSHRPHPLEPPRPMEPRPTLSTSLAEPRSTTSVRRDSMRGPHGDVWTQGQSLPGLRDILSPTPPQPHSYSSSWGAPAPSPPAARHSHDYFRQAGVHPPMALLPPTDRSPPYAPQNVRRYEPSSLDRRSSIPASPYSSYSGPQEYVEHPSMMHGHARPVAYPPPNGYPGQYAVTAGPPVDDHSHGGQGPPPPPPPPMGMYDRPLTGPPPTYQAPGSEGQKKYIGVETTPEGTFHCYEGGYRIPTHVDGEQVNPAWGLTKANKPRKRLALACLECREKKIKCEPGTISCVQCEKAKRVCRRAPQQTQADTLVGSPWVAPQMGAGTADVEPDPLSPSAMSDNHSKRTSEPHQSPPAAKRLRSDSPQSHHSGFISHGADATDAEAEAPARASVLRRSRGPIQFNDDPLEVKPKDARCLLDLYFAHSQCYAIFPPRFFVRWATGQSPKTTHERLVLYAMLAYGSLFVYGASEDDRSLKDLGRECADLAFEELKRRFGGLPRPSTAVAHILLGLYWFARNQPAICWDHIGAGMTIMFGRLMINNLDRPEKTEYPLDFGFSREQYGECSRRCLWIAFLLDRLGSTATSILKPQDILIRLPCSDDDYECSRESNAPLLDNGVVDPARTSLAPDSPVSPLAWLAVFTSVLGDVTDYSWRAQHRSEASYPADYQIFYADINARLTRFTSRLPPHLRYSKDNLDRGIQGGYADVLIAIHSVRHSAIMELNRRVRHAWLPVPDVQRNMRAAWREAMDMVVMMCDIQSARREIVREPTSPRTAAPGPPTTWAFSVSYAGHAAVMAVDIVAAGGPEAVLRRVREGVGQTTAALAELARYWEYGKDQMLLCQKRKAEIDNLIARPMASHSGAWLSDVWGIDTSMGKSKGSSHPSWYPAEWDCTYGVEPFTTYFEALKDEK